MTPEIIFVFVLIVAALVLFGGEWFRVDLTAMLIMVAVMVSGVIGPEAALSGFANRATVTVAAMFVISRGLYLSGAVEGIGKWLLRLLDRSQWLMMSALLVFVGAISAFINNTAVIAVMIPTVLEALREREINSARILLPMSFASMFGGVCTLLGTSTNILVSSIAQDNGLAAFGLFELAPLGLVLAAVGMGYLMFFGIRLIPDRQDKKVPEEGYDVDAYLTEVVVEPNSPLIGEKVGDNFLSRKLGLDILELRRDRRRSSVPEQDTKLRVNDILTVRCDLERLRDVEQSQGVSIRPAFGDAEALLDAQEAEDEGESILLEAVIAPDGPLEGASLDDVDFRQTHGAVALAVRQRGKLERDNPQKLRLKGGDLVLVRARRGSRDQIKKYAGFVVVSEAGAKPDRSEKMPFAIAVVVGFVLLAASGLVDVVTAATVGALGMVVCGCLKVEEAYQAIDWKIIFLLAGVLSLGVAMEDTGAAHYLAEQLKTQLADHPQALLAGFFVLTTLLTNVISNNASAALMAPVAISTAQSLQVDPRPFLVAVAAAGSLSFMTPIGYQTNTLVYGAGPYRFRDFLLVGTPLNILLCVVGVWVIPMIWSF